MFTLSELELLQYAVGDYVYGFCTDENKIEEEYVPLVTKLETYINDIKAHNAAHAALQAETARHRRTIRCLFNILQKHPEVVREIEHIFFARSAL